MHLLAQSAVLRALGWSLLNSLWQMAFLWLVYVAFTHIFRRASSGAKHGLAVLLLGSGAVWTMITFLDSLLYTDPTISAPFTYGWNVALFPKAHWINAALGTVRRMINEGLPYCSTLYLLILLFLFVRYGRQYFYSRKLGRTSLSRPTAEMRLFTEQTARQMGIKKEVRIWFSRLVEGPVTLGSLKPVILIPLATVCNLNTQQVESLILHELAHIRKQDYLLPLWIAVLEAFFFFNPFSRALIRSIQKEREHRCDDLVLQFRYDPHVYVAALMALARSLQSNPRLVLAAAGSNDGLLLQRVKRILKLNTAPEPLKGRSLLFLCWTIFIAGVALSRPALTIIRDRIENPVQTASTTAMIPNVPERRSSTIETLVSVNIPATGRQGSLAVKAARKKTAHSNSCNEDGYNDSDPDIIQPDAPSDDENDASVIGYASTILPRDYSIVAHTATTASPGVEVARPGSAADGCPLQAPAPYVPNSSFSFQRVQDSTLPGAQYVYMQQMASREVEQAILKMQKELQWQLKVLQQSGSKDMADLKQKQQIIVQQLQLQQQYLEKQLQLQKKLEKIGKKRVIVVI